MITELIDKIVAARKNKLESQRAVYPRNTFIASDIVGCDRYMVYSVLNWQDRQALDGAVLARLEEGRRHEKQIIAELLELGFEVIEGQKPFEIKNRSGEIICRGKIDGILRDGKNKYPFEIKTMNPNVFNSVSSLDDFNKKEYLRKYIRQIQLYLYGNNLDEGMFILDNLAGQQKILPVSLDYGECEKILQQLERCWELVKQKKYPDPISYDENICGNCPFATTCLRDIPAENRLDFSTDEDLPTLLARYDELKPLAKEFEEVDDAIKSKFAIVDKTKDILVGDNWRISIKIGKRKSYEVPDEIKQQYMTEKETKLVKIIKL